MLQNELERLRAGLQAVWDEWHKFPSVGLPSLGSIKYWQERGKVVSDAPKLTKKQRMQEKHRKNQEWLKLHATE